MKNIKVPCNIAFILNSFKDKKQIQNEDIKKKREWILDFILKVNFFKLLKR